MNGNEADSARPAPAAGVAESFGTLLLSAVLLPLLAVWMLLAGFTGLGTRARYMLIGAPAVAALGALAFQSLTFWPKRPLNMDFILRGTLAFTVLLGAVNIAYDFSKAHPGSYFVENDADGYLRTNLGNFYATMRQLDSLSAGSRVLFMWEPKGFYCPDDITCLPDTLFDHWAYPLRRGTADSDSLMPQWRDQDDIDYLLVWGLEDGSGFGYDLWLGKDAFALSENALFPAALAKYMQPVWTDGAAYTLYTWKEAAAGS